MDDRRERRAVFPAALAVLDDALDDPARDRQRKMDAAGGAAADGAGHGTVRGVHGTGAPASHKAGTDVVDASIDQLIPGDAANQTWLNVTTGDPYTIVDGNGLLLSNTEQAIFLKASTTKLPWLPGDYDWVDPNTGRYKFDMGPYDEQKGFDSYVQG